MATFWFSPPVFVKTELVGVSYACNNVRGASEQLLKWPKRGPKWHRASALCLAAWRVRRSTPRKSEVPSRLPLRRPRCLFPTRWMGDHGKVCESGVASRIIITIV
ncbi:conserved hypothetical protein [Mesorhizobium delmotii]|uniref:DUF982 domain-containing protein n=1 Tax=Mesorhizobium delmotii TaxID=1631247 RepID=A0A2P9API2_9HYPH|nr:conserved hypothetical protein [Mesorhizobium delmotii]